MKRAILIASSDFSADSEIEPLRFPLNDVDAMEVTLRAEDFSFEVEKVLNATHWETTQKLDAWMSKADYDDLMLIYFSGHGKLSNARDLFLTCANTKSKTLIATGLKYTVLTDLIRQYSLQKVAIILDCCYAGRAMEGGRGDARGAVDEQVRAVVEPGSGIFFLGASGKNQTAEERELDGHGRFTKQIIEGLTSGDADIDGDGNVSAKDLSTYVKQQLLNQHASQEPIEGGAYQGELILGGNRRKQLKAALATIAACIEENKKHFTRETYRDIDDYVEDIGRSEDIKSVFSDRRYLVLREYAANDANIEKVIRAFWEVDVKPREPPKPGPPPPVSVAPAAVRPPPPVGVVRPEYSAPPESTKERKITVLQVVGLVVGLLVAGLGSLIWSNNVNSGWPFFLFCVCAGFILGYRLVRKGRRAKSNPK